MAKTLHASHEKANDGDGTAHERQVAANSVIPKNGEILSKIILLEGELESLWQDYDFMTEIFKDTDTDTELIPYEKEPWKVRFARRILGKPRLEPSKVHPAQITREQKQTISAEAATVEKKIETLMARRDELMAQLEASEREQHQATSKVRYLQDYVRRKERLALGNVSETSLEKAQVQWLRARIESDYEKSKAVLEPLEERDAPLPSKEKIIKSVLKGITKDQAEFMMREGVPPFGSKIKPVYNSLSRLRKLVDAQPATMSIPGGQVQQAMTIWTEAEAHLKSQQDESGDNITGYEWEFVQDQQIIKPFPGDDVNKPIGERISLFKKHLPKGMHGTDRRTWAMLMAEGLRNGKPLDCKFPNDAKDAAKYVEWLFTVLDEEGEFLTSNKVRCLVGGRFDPAGRDARLGGYYAGLRYDLARFRASVSGLIES